MVLVDTDLERPRLHHAARVSNASGLAEVLRGEAPVADVTRVVEEDRLFCVPAGNVLDDPAARFDPPRWSRLCKAFSDAGVTVVAYVPVQAAWLDAVLDTATDVVLLTEQYRRLQWPNRDDAPPLRAVLGPMLVKDPPPNPTGRPGSRNAPLLGFDLPPGAKDLDDLEIIELEPEDEPLGAFEDADASIASEGSGADEADPQPPDADAVDVPARDAEPLELQTEAEPVAQEPGMPAADAHDATEDRAEEEGPAPEPEEARSAPSPETEDDEVEAAPPRPEVDLGGGVTVGTTATPTRAGKPTTDSRIRRGRRRMAMGALLVAAAGVVWVLSRSGGDTDVADSVEPPPAETTPAERGPVAPAQARPAPSTVRPVSPAAAFSVGVASYTDAARAREEASRLAAAFPEISWMVAPADLDGTVYHRVVGGLVPDSAAALGLGSELARGGVSDWLVRRSGWVVELGTWPSREAAESRRAAAAADGIPAYLSRIELTDGSERYSVYAGAYGDESEAGYLLGRSRDAGFDAHVVERMGRPPS